MKDALLRAIAAALDGLDIGFCAFDADDRTLAWNASFLEFFPEHDGFVQVGERYADNLRRFYAQRLGADEQHLLERYVAEGVERHRVQRRPYEFEHRGFRIRVSSVEIGSFGRIRVWRRSAPPSAVERRPAPAARGAFDRNASLVLEQIADGMLVVDSGDRVVWANKAFLGLYGLSSVEQAVGRTFDSLYRDTWGAAPNAPGFLRSLETLAENQRYSGAPYELRLPGERWTRVVEQRGDEADGRSYFLHSDITAIKRKTQDLQDAERKLQELAITDGLTGLANRRRFDEALATECRRAQREGLPLSLVMIDIDHFKALNDAHGHPAGDRVLQRLGAVLVHHAKRAGDLAACYGGEEFALLLPNTSAPRASGIAQRLRSAVVSLNQSSFQKTPITLSAGVCSTDNPLTDGTPADLVRLTDEALYAAKHQGRDRVVLARGNDGPDAPPA